MTEADRQKKIARALVRMSQLAVSLSEIGSEFGKASVQLERLAAEFEQGRYLPHDENPDPDAAPVAGETAPA